MVISPRGGVYPEKAMDGVSFQGVTNKEALGSLGRTIKGQRARLGLSQTELANLAEVSLNFVSQMESGKPTAQIGKVLDLLSALGLCFSLEYGKNRIFSQIIDDR